MFRISISWHSFLSVQIHFLTKWSTVKLGFYFGIATRASLLGNSGDCVNYSNCEAAYTVNNKKDAYHSFIVTIIQVDGTDHEGHDKRNQYEK